MKMRVEVPYGQATALRLGTLRARATGLGIAAPTLAAGDFKITQDDGVGEDNVDNIPTVDTGTGDILWTISAAEATAPSANGNYRVMRCSDAAGAEWLDMDVIIVTTDHQSAVKPNGVTRQVTPDATPGATSFAVTDAALPSTALGAKFKQHIALVVVSDVADDVNCAALVTGYSKTGNIGTFTYGAWTRTPTGTAANIRINLYAAGIGQVEALSTVALAAINEEADTALTTALTESYAADGATVTVAQALYMLLALLSEFSVSGTTLTAKKLDGSTAAGTFTLSDATNPTSITRAS